jgi:hypothetical protein
MCRQSLSCTRWQWRCGFYPGSKPGECTCGTATDFDEARAEFETAWRVFLAKRTEADFKAWRDQRTERKYAARAAGQRVFAWRHPSQSSAATQKAAKTASLLIMVNISSPRFDIGTSRPATRSASYDFFAGLTVGKME